MNKGIFFDSFNLGRTMGRLAKRLGLDTEGKNELSGLFGRVKFVSEFLGDAFECIKDKNLSDAVEAALPWADVSGPLFEAIKETVPPFKFAAKLFQEMTKEPDPLALAHLACAMAYQRSIEQTASTFALSKGAKKTAREIKSELRKIDDEEIDFKGFSYFNATYHPFIKMSEEILNEFLESAGYDDAERRKFILEVRSRFVVNLKTLVSHGDFREKFAPFTDLMDLGTDESQAYDALLEHADQQRRLFEEMPVFGREPFALSHIYIEPECGELTWIEIKKGISVKKDGKDTIRKADPFKECDGGRQPLLETILDMFKDPNFNDAIVIQAVAGAGKSTFTLKLCSELISEGLRPIRILLRDLRFDFHISEALPKAVRVMGEDWQRRKVLPNDLFLKGSIFNQEIDFRGNSICPYVLILDGWDEISVTASKSVKEQLGDALYQIRQEFLRKSGAPVRVILTGRPSEDFMDSRFLLEKTPILTIRPIKPNQLEDYVKNLKKYIYEEQPIKIKGFISWGEMDPNRFHKIFERYKSDYENNQKENEADNKNRSSSLEVLGLPLLAYLAIKLMSLWDGDLTKLVDNPTTLYRNLTDMTCPSAGKVKEDSVGIESQNRIYGKELRDLLHKTAAAMTLMGEESISYYELSLRLNEDALNEASKNTESQLSSLMISFYFKGGNKDLGCEFLHKSFREYLFAEGIVEVLKKYGRRDDINNLQERELIWKDFEKTDPRHSLSRELSGYLSAQWLSQETISFMGDLIEWEIKREAEKETDIEEAQRTESLDLNDWMKVRDTLADLWDWWAESIHLRPQSQKYKSSYKLEPAYTEEIVAWCMPQNYNSIDSNLPESLSFTTIDSHLGDAFFRLCVWVHYHIAELEGWIDAQVWRKDNSSSSEIIYEKYISVNKRRYQSLIKQNDSHWILFKPSGYYNNNFQYFIARINSEKRNAENIFPSSYMINGVDLSETDLYLTYLNDADLSGTLLCGALLTGAFLMGTNLNGAYLHGAYLIRSCLVQADLREADLREVDFRDADLSNADLRGVVLNGANLHGANLRDTNLENANIRGADLSNTNLSGANFRGTNLSSFMLYNDGQMVSYTSGSNLDGSNLTGVDFSEADLRGATLTDIKYFIGVNFQNTLIKDAILDEELLQTAINQGAIL